MTKPPNLYAEASARFVLAMSQQQRGQTDTAKATLARAKAITARQSRENWLDWLINDLLRREAEALILGEPPKPKE